MERADSGETVSRIYDELRRVAAREMRRQRQEHAVQTTGLFEEAYLRLAAAGSPEAMSREHFMALASHAMRQILVGAARSVARRGTEGGAVRIEVDEAAPGAGGLDLLQLDQWLSELERIDPRAARVVDLRYFAGYTDLQVAETLGVSLAAVRRDWEFARSWLGQRMRSGAAPADTADAADAGNEVRAGDTVMAHAFETFGSPQKANHWLHRPNRVFQGKTPLEAMQSDPQAVEIELTRIDYGVYI